MVVAIYFTTRDIYEARKIAKILVKEKLAACVNIIPKIESVFSWEGKIEEDSECVIIAKTTEKNSEEAVQKVKQIHSYDVPDIMVIPVVGGLNEYLTYVEEETK
jgi:periplasmic divalent cation tolerance protein